LACNHFLFGMATSTVLVWLIGYEGLYCCIISMKNTTRSTTAGCIDTTNLSWYVLHNCTYHTTVFSIICLSMIYIILRINTTLVVFWG
jgi:hypothetical protein